MKGARPNRTFQATIPSEVRDILLLASDDPISDEAYLKGIEQILDEWDPDEDNEAYQLIP